MIRTPGQLILVILPLVAGLLATHEPAAAAAAAATAAAPAQAETVCIQCHSALPDKLGAPVNLWRKSIHAENGISCNSCHGGDPANAADAMNRARGFLGAPKETEIPSFCGRCHPGVLKDYLASAHGRALGKGGPTCVTCHSNHEVLKASLTIINEKTCTQCHTFERAAAIKAAMQQTEGYIVNIDQRLTRFQSSGVDTEEMGKTLFAIRNRFHSLFHEVNVERVRSESTQINADLAKLEKAIRGIEDEHAKRRVIGGIAVAFVLVVAVVAHLMKKTYD